MRIRATGVQSVYAAREVPGLAAGSPGSPRSADSCSSSIRLTSLVCAPARHAWDRGCCDFAGVSTGGHGLGTRNCFALDSIVHHHEWEKNLGAWYPPALIAQHLESEPVIVPPVLAKTGLLAEPVLCLVWALAFDS